MPSSTLNSYGIDMLLEYLAALLPVIESQDWTLFEEKTALSTNPKMFKKISKSIAQCEELGGMTLRHACVRFNPPPSLIERMIKIYPLALRSRDCMGRTPLHVAAGSEASPYVMKLLTRYYPDACDIQDNEGRTPLHFVCDSSCELFEGDEDEVTPRGPPSLDVVRVLLSGSLYAATLEDLDEINAVEYAILSDASFEVVNLLQRAVQTVMKNQGVISMQSQMPMSSIPAGPIVVGVQ